MIHEAVHITIDILKIIGRIHTFNTELVDVFLCTQRFIYNTQINILHKIFVPMILCSKAHIYFYISDLLRRSVFILFKLGFNIENIFSVAVG